VRLNNTCFSLAVKCFIVFLVIFLPRAVSNIFFNEVTSLGIRMVLLLIDLIILTLVFKCISLCKKSNKEYYKASEVASYNKHREVWRPVRYIFLVICVLTLYISIVATIAIALEIDSFHLLFLKVSIAEGTTLDFFYFFLRTIIIMQILGLVSGFYFMACIPIPGKRLRERQKERQGLKRFIPAIERY